MPSEKHRGKNFQHLLIIRFSSLGDIVQAMGVLAPLKAAYPALRINWVTKPEFAPLLRAREEIDRVFVVDDKASCLQNLLALLGLGWRLRQRRYDLAYDAHSNLRSTLLWWVLWPFSGTRWIRRSKERWKRFLLFRCRINRFPAPFKGAESYWRPLKKVLPQMDAPTAGHWPLWPLPTRWEERLGEKICGMIALVPGAAWPMKRWPLEHFKKLISLLPGQAFVVLGGPGESFCRELETSFPSRVANLAGQLDLSQACSVVARARLVVAADTGLLHVADLAGTPGIALMGPTAFGFCTHSHIHTLQVELLCRPCSKDGRGRCSQKIYQRCMVDITPEMVAEKVLQCFV